MLMSIIGVGPFAIMGAAGLSVLVMPIMIMLWKDVVKLWCV